MSDIENNVVLTKQNEMIDANDGFENYTLVEVNKKTYAIKTKCVILIEKMMELDFSYNLPSAILGFIKYDEKPIGVIDLRETLKEDRIIYDTSSNVVLVKKDDIITAFVVDRVIDIKRLSKYRINPVPYSTDEDFWEGIYIENDENIYIINPANIVKHINNNPQKYLKKDNNQNYVANDDKSKIILKERKDSLANIYHLDKYLITPLYDMGVSFVVNSVKYYINMASVKEFYKVNNSKFIKVPNTPDYIFGLINIKGEYIVVLDIRNFYANAKTEIKEKSTIIILDSNEYKIGILADEILESMNINFDKIVQNKIQKQDDSKFYEFVYEDEIYQIVDVEKLLKDDRLTLC